MTTGLRYIKVLLPLRLGWIPTYTSSTLLAEGTRVNVEFAHRAYIGVVLGEDNDPRTASDRIQEISGVSILPAISRNEILFWKFLSSYYLCTIGEVYKAAYPSLTLKSETAASAAIERMKKSLSKKEESLGKKHSERVMQRLRDEISSLRSAIAAADAGMTEEPGRITPGKPVLIHAGSRTKEYLKIISECTDRKQQALVLTPEIAFCKKMEKDLEGLTPMIHVVNSAKTAAERREAASAARSGRPDVFLGTRAALFLPFKNLGAVIIDEEQDSSYKQNEPAPRYNGRDAAIALASIHSAQVYLGSSCPSLESIYNCRTGKYTLIKGESGRKFTVIDLAAEKKKNGICGNFSYKLAEKIRCWNGSTILIRGWEKEDALRQEADAMFPGRDIKIMTLAGFKEKGCPAGSLVAVMQADALVSRDDFRCDEKSVQLASMLCALAQEVILQSGSSSRFRAMDDMDILMQERKEFGFPPFKRMVEIKRHGDNAVVKREFLPRDASLQARKTQIFNEMDKNVYADVDPA